MDILSTFYDNAPALRRELVSSISTRLSEAHISSTELDERCDSPGISWEIVVKDPDKLSGDYFLDVCFALELEIEKAMPLDASPEQIRKVCEVMESEGHGVVACTGNSIRSPDSPRNATLSALEIAYSEQAELYVRLRALDEMSDA